MEHPTRSKRDKKGQSVIEAEEWPDEARIVSLMDMGFSYHEAWEMTFAEYRRYTSIAHAWAIRPDDRVHAFVKADQEMMDREFGDNY